MTEQKLIKQMDALKSKIMANPQAAQTLGPKLRELFNRAEKELTLVAPSGDSQKVCIGHCIQHCNGHQISDTLRDLPSVDE